ncbi:MAG: hypothetical protein KGL64_04995 [Acidobacteriota bacterium]|nr:hypothetical protein [Acidobacteriota bacterium]
MEINKRLDEAFKLPAKVEPTLEQEFLKAANDIVVLHMLTFEPTDNVTQAHLCYLYMRTAARTIKAQLRQLASLAAFANSVGQMSLAEGEIRNGLVRMLREAIWNTANAIEGDLRQLDEIASLQWYGSMPGDLCWLQQTVRAAYELLREKVPS